jgi:hypothetical protein
MTVAMVIEDPGPAVQRLLLGQELRKLREAAGMTAEEANLQVPKWYRGKLSKVEHGQLRVTLDELNLLLKEYRATGGDADRVRALATESRRKTTPARVPDWAKQYVRLLNGASEIRLWFGEMVPGTLQTQDYAKAQLSASLLIPPVDIQPTALERERRGDRLFHEEAPRVWIVLGEEALRRPVGGPAVLKGQLQRLRDLALLQHVSFRTVPIAAGAHPALGCPFTLVYVESTGTTIAYEETLTDGDYIKNPHAYTLAFDHVSRVALSEGESLALLERLIVDLE